ncbi:MAG TPA: hypothetical protein VG015_02370 [Candidatus Dormibacteraeota bacterium]|jgi:hypothetical protein|nr:hypothetical protein [Candidatus Dormibacteraeota bacterium]
MAATKIDQKSYFKGVKMAPYDLVKEIVIAVVVVGLLTMIAALALSSPDVPPITIQTWAQSDPLDFSATAAGELAGTTTSSQYGPPYNDGTSSVQSIGFISPQTWFGKGQPVDPPQDFVLQPLQYAKTDNPILGVALRQYLAADPTQQGKWLDSYSKAVTDAQNQGSSSVAPADYGPVEEMMNSLLAEARSGALDGLLLSSKNFYQTDYTKTLLFLGDGTYFVGQADAQHLKGNQWGMMNETGSYPGQTWLWLYTFWYQIPPFNSASNGDLLIVLTMTVLTLGLALVPFIPGLRDIPRWVPIYRLIWRKHYSKP